MKQFSILFTALSSIAFAYGAVEQCPGYENSPIQFIGGTVPDLIPLPGEITMDIYSRVLELTPDVLIFDLALQMLNPPLAVPCLDGVGSCPYELCPMLTGVEGLCDQFPEGQECDCPFLPGDFNLTNIVLQIPDFGPALGPIMTNDYKARGLIYGQGAPDEQLGCIDFTFRMEYAGSGQRRIKFT